MRKSFLTMMLALALGTAGLATAPRDAAAQVMPGGGPVAVHYDGRGRGWATR